MVERAVRRRPRVAGVDPLAVHPDLEAEPERAHGDIEPANHSASSAKARVTEAAMTSATPAASVTTRTPGWVVSADGPG